MSLRKRIQDKHKRPSKARATWVAGSARERVRIDNDMVDRAGQALKGEAPPAAPEDEHDDAVEIRFEHESDGSVTVIASRPGADAA